MLKPLIPDLSGPAAAGQRLRANPPPLRPRYNVLVGSVYLGGGRTMRRFWRIGTFPLNSRLWKLESEATGKKKKAHCGGIYRRSRTLFVLYIAELRGVSSTFQMAFTAQTRMPLTIAFRKSRLVPSARPSRALCLPAACLGVTRNAEAEPVNASLKS